MTEDLNTIANNLSQNISYLRKSRSLTQGQLSKLAGIPRSTITNFESGSGNPSLSNLVLLATALEVQVQELLAPPIKETATLIKKNDIPFKKKKDCFIYNLLPSPIKGLGLEKFEINPKDGFSGIPHLKGTKEYFTVIQGKSRVVVAGEEYIVTKGDVLIFRGNEKHSYYNPGHSTCLAISILVKEDIFNEE